MTGLLIKLGIVLLILLIVGGYLAYRAFIGKLKKILGKSVTAAQPAEVRLIRDRDVEWRDRESVADQVRELRDAGFRTITVYRIDELDDIQLVALAHPEKGWTAAVYEQEKAGVWCDLVAELGDGVTLTLSNAKLGMRLSQPPGHEKVFLKRASVRRLLRAFVKHLGDRPVTPVGAADFADVFERSYRREMAWRRAQAAEDEGETLERDPELDRDCRPLFDAIAAGDLEALRRHLDGGVEPEGRDARGRTPLIAAAARGDLAMARAILKAGADVDARAPGTPGQAAMERQASISTMAEAIDDPEARKLMKGFGALVDGGKARLPLNVTALSAAIESGNAELVAALIKAGADLFGRGGLTPLQFAAGQGDPDVVRALLDGGAPPDQPGEDGWTPLMSAAFEGFAEIVRLLLDAGADPNWKADRETAISLAADHGYREIVDMLSPLSKAKFAKKAEKAMAGDWQVRLNPTAKRLMTAARNGVAPLVAKLLATGLHPDTPENDGEDEDGRVTPLMMAAQGGHVDVLRALIAAGADVNRTSGRETALARAASPATFMDPADQPETVRVLVEAGASLELLEDKPRARVAEIMT